MTRKTPQSLVQVKAPHFCADMVLVNGIVIKADPILSWAIGKGRDELRRQFKVKGWTVSIIGWDYNDR